VGADLFPAAALGFVGQGGGLVLQGVAAAWAGAAAAIVAVAAGAVAVEEGESAAAVAGGLLVLVLVWGRVVVRCVLRV